MSAAAIVPDESVNLRIPAERQEHHRGDDAVPEYRGPALHVHRVLCGPQLPDHAGHNTRVPGDAASIRSARETPGQNGAAAQGSALALRRYGWADRPRVLHPGAADPQHGHGGRRTGRGRGLLWW